MKAEHCVQETCMRVVRQLELGTRALKFAFLICVNQYWSPTNASFPRYGSSKVTYLLNFFQPYFEFGCTEQFLKVFIYGS